MFLLIAFLKALEPENDTSMTDLYLNTLVKTSYAFSQGEIDNLDVKNLIAFISTYDYSDFSNTNTEQTDDIVDSVKMNHFKILRDRFISRRLCHPVFISLIYQYNSILDVNFKDEELKKSIEDLDYFFYMCYHKLMHNDSDDEYLER